MLIKNNRVKALSIVAIKIVFELEMNLYLVINFFEYQYT